MLFTGTSPRKYLFVRHSWVQVDIETLASKEACSLCYPEKNLLHYKFSYLLSLKLKKKKLDI